MYIPPSGLLGPVEQKTVNSINKRFKNTPLRAGVIVECYEIDDEKNKTKVTPEYKVVTSEVDGKTGSKIVTYSNCISSDGFGGIADFFEYKLRSTTEFFHKKKDPKQTSHNVKKQNGTAVLILCLDGFSESAIIVGGLPNLSDEKRRKTTLTKDNELHLEGEYNGLNWQVNKDGEFTVTFKSKTDNDGKPQDEEAGGTFAKIDKTGSIQLDTDNEASLKIDKPGQSISANAAKDISLTAKANVNITADAAANITAKGDLALLAQGAAKASSKSTFDLEAKGDLTAKGASIKLESKGQLELKSQIAEINAPIINLGKGGLPAVTLNTKFLGVGNLGIPVICSAIGPFSSKVFVAN